MGLQGTWKSNKLGKIRHENISSIPQELKKKKPQPTDNLPLKKNAKNSHCSTGSLLHLLFSLLQTNILIFKTSVVSTRPPAPCPRTTSWLWGVIPLDQAALGVAKQTLLRWTQGRRAWVVLIWAGNSEFVELHRFSSQLSAEWGLMLLLLLLLLLGVGVAQTPLGSSQKSAGAVQC